MLNAKNVCDQLRGEMEKIINYRKRKTVEKKIETSVSEEDRGNNEGECRERMKSSGEEQGREVGREINKIRIKAEQSSISVCRRVCAAIAAGYYSNAARVSANSDRIFYSLPFAEEGSGILPSKSDEDEKKERKENMTNDVYKYDSDEKITLHVHPSSVLTYGSSAACVTSGCWSRQPQYVLYQVRTGTHSLSPIAIMHSLLSATIKYFLQ